MSKSITHTGGGSAAPVPRVHCDYTAESAPRRLQQLVADGLFHNLQSSGPEAAISDEEIERFVSGRFAFVNVWRSIDREQPVLQKPLAVCDERTVSFCCNSNDQPSRQPPCVCVVATCHRLIGITDATGGWMGGSGS